MQTIGTDILYVLLLGGVVAFILFLKVLPWIIGYKVVRHVLRPGVTAHEPAIERPTGPSTLAERMGYGQSTVDRLEGVEPFSRRRRGETGAEFKKRIRDHYGDSR